MRDFRVRVLHQDSLYPAGAAAVPHLIDLLADDHAPDRTPGHELLAKINCPARARIRSVRACTTSPGSAATGIWHDGRDGSGTADTVSPRSMRFTGKRTRRSAPVCRRTCGCSTTPTGMPGV